jgi:4-amino-4-deoxy-L-arabinose transferase-like glycosyltransferase
MHLETEPTSISVRTPYRTVFIKRKALLLALQLCAIPLILSVATVLRVNQLNALGYNSDEAVYAGQAAAIAQVPVLEDIFPVFRAHPLLFQFSMAVVFQLDFGDWQGRLLGAAVGLATVYLIYALASDLYGRRAGVIAALIVAVMPYHVVASRQAMLDGPMAFFATFTLYMLARFSRTGRRIDLIACGAGMGLAFLTKEISIILVGAVYAFFAVSPEVRVRISDIFLSLAAMAVVMLSFPLSVRLAGAGGAERTQQYLVWQLFRRPNHTWDFYPTVVPPAIGVLVIVAAVLGLWLLRRHNGWREKLLVLWIIVPVVFFQLWPTKGFLYLLPIAPAIAILAARTLARWPTRDLRWRTWRVPQYAPGLLLTAAITLPLLSASWKIVHPVGSNSYLAGTGGVPGGREAGLWIDQNVPEGATFMTIGPSMANIVKFYGRRQAYGLSVSPNPLHRNPSYEPIANPDYEIRTGEVQFAVWDAFSAERSAFFSDRLLEYTRQHNGRVVHTETILVTNSEGHTIETPIIVIFAVRP